jgi:hypothetical protein
MLERPKSPTHHAVPLIGSGIALVVWIALSALLVERIGLVAGLGLGVWGGSLLVLVPLYRLEGREGDITGGLSADPVQQLDVAA